MAHGVAGLVVSNHGGRQLDRSVTGLRALPEVLAAVDGRCQVWVDGGVRRGLDVAIACALGARGVLLGRPHLWGIAGAGEAGAARVLSIVREELDRAMALLGGLLIRTIWSPGATPPPPDDPPGATRPAGRADANAGFAGDASFRSCPGRRAALRRS